MRRGGYLSDTQNGILSQLARLQYATSNQLAHFCGVQKSAISKAIQDLLEQGLIDGSLLTRPMILHLTSAGAKILGVPLPAGNRHASWSVMAHACHLNAFEIEKTKQHSGFHMLSRLQLLKQGLNPAHGEHAAVDADKKTWFILLDDYKMGSDRISRSWTRRHAPNLKYWPDPTGRVWRDTVHKFVVVTTNPFQAERHKAWIEEEALPAEVFLISPLWKD